MRKETDTTRFSEMAFLDWIGAQATTGRGLRLGIGDDMAIVRVGREEILTASDMLLDGVHFDTRVHRLEAIGRKALACCLSDCAAMAVRPVAATLSVAMSRGMTRGDARRLFRGAVWMAEAFDVAIAGGDTTCWSKPLVIDVGIVAQPYPNVPPVTRGGAKVGDRLYVTGVLGGSARGHHLDFQPRVREARALAAALGGRLHAMMDISDGLALDMHRLCRASGVGAELDARLLEAVVSPAARQLSAYDGVAPLDHALHDGEDFELLLAVDGNLEDAAVGTPDGPAGGGGAADIGGPVFPIGRITDAGLVWRDERGHVRPLQPRGFVHQ